MEIHIQQAGYVANEPSIEQIEFLITPGEIVGLIGGNGAGKSTTIQSVLGVIPYFEGDISIPSYGYVPERPLLYEHFTLREHLQFLIDEFHDENLWHKANQLLTLFQIDKRLDDLPIYFSKGMQQKVMLVLAFLIERPLYILDEPFMGLDPRAMRELLMLIDERKQQGASFLLCTHQLEMAEKLCDHYVLLHEGRMQAQGTLQELQQIVGQPISLLDIFYELQGRL
ncbi:ABC transporter ATP-binding protein [Solibacillus sp. MA9]|uniref:ABC transporter ATP-binding protein n=1 Tax=Solibacillus palustris TaxID=2908203 RepID=A0ABS9UDE1_9BACL|nr:ABC transporter ATP-binding protein [Solibacillus sp. MA9]MCH7322352.1 ABC transporter ATP-binding protein [Solibacillus sp. MA9]